MRANPPHLILLDVMMPLMDGYEVSRRIKGDEALPYIPIILVTARDSTQDKVEGLDAGADDYLTKPINFPELEARVRSMLRIKRLQDELDQKNRELEEANKRLRKLSITDGLTELFNHRHVHELLHEEFERSKRSGEPIAVAMLDLDQLQAGERHLRAPHGRRHPLRDGADPARDGARDRHGGALRGRGVHRDPTRRRTRRRRAQFAERVRAAVGDHVFRDEGQRGAR